MQNLKDPSFLRTRTTALHHGDWDGRIAPPSNISWTCSLTSSTWWGGILRNLSLKGSLCSSGISMTCSVASVQPISPGSRQKMWWNSMSSRLAFCAVSGGQSDNLPRPPPFSSVSISNCWRCSVVRGTASGASSSNLFSSSGETTASGTMFAAAMRPMSLPPAR